MPATPQQTAAISMIADWSKWIVAVETAAIAAIAAFVKPLSIGARLNFARYAVAAALVCFVISIILASIVLLSLPAAFQDIEATEKVWDRVAAIGPFTPPLIKVVGGQLILFGFGICAFGAAVVVSVICGSI
jgi:hypothetical protein